MAKQYEIMSRLPITERQSHHSTNLDECDGYGIQRATRACEAEIFSGYGPWSALTDNKIIHKLVSAVEYIVQALREAAKDEYGGEALVVFSGAGTSGRLCWTACHLLNALAKAYKLKVKGQCSLAGGNTAFNKSVEHAEDDAQAGKASLSEILLSHGQRIDGDASSSKKRPKTTPLVLVGVTCGMSATWVASQINYALSLDQAKVILLGFTPFESCRGMFAKPEVFQGIKRGEEEGKITILDPVVGPELVTGSTRLKSGTATKICLEMLIYIACEVVKKHSSLEASEREKNKRRQGTNSIPTKEELAMEAELQEMASQAPSLSQHFSLQNSFINIFDHFGWVENLLGQYSGALDAAYKWHNREVLKQEVRFDDILDPMTEVYVKGNEFLDIKVHPLQMGANSLNKNARIVYAGYGREGILGIIDASEQLPTFGCLQQDFQGFLLDQSVPEDILDVVGKERGLEAFEEMFKTLTCDDTLVFIFNIDVLQLNEKNKADALDWIQRVREEREKGKTFSVIFFIAKQDSGEDPITGDPVPYEKDDSEYAGAMVRAMQGVKDAAFVDILTDLTELSVICGTFDLTSEIALKSAINCFSSGANVMNGKVYRNRMIDVRLSNDKLFERAIQIVRDVSGKPRNVAIKAILDVIFQSSPEEREKNVDMTPDQLVEKNRSRYVGKASKMRKVVPTAVLIATGKYTFEEAQAALKSNGNNISKLIHDVVV